MAGCRLCFSFFSLHVVPIVCGCCGLAVVKVLAIKALAWLVRVLTFWGLRVVWDLRRRAFE